ncbi:MAG: hypothetical protein NC041_06185 [Bacteroides sp.]|nr:hypothetical protein [Prevotella sp.]MCM1406884.1 hypothetical protein [Treponema brennaborense]MCM1470035.1 hypothetical protein [Bacteroides sp.]
MADLQNTLIDNAKDISQIRAAAEGGSALQNVLRAFEKFYTVKTCAADAPFAPFCALAEFHAHGEQFFLTKAAKVADIDTNEYVFFAQEKFLDAENLAALADAAWDRGLRFVKPYFGHKNSDVSLVILADESDSAAKKFVKKLHRYKSYKFGIYGWSAFNAAFCDFSLRKIFSNSRGENLKKNLQKILFE